MSQPSSRSTSTDFRTIPSISAESLPVQPDRVAGSVSPPSMQTIATNRHAELLETLRKIDALSPAELSKSDLPEVADRLLTEINEARKSTVELKRTRRFKLFNKDDSVNRLIAKLEIASRREKIPVPYPIDKDPLGLEVWAAQEGPNNVAAIAKEFPQLRNALCVYLDDTGTNHLARVFHEGSAIDFELDLRSAKSWRLMPVYDAIHSGPAANFIVLIKCVLFLSDWKTAAQHVEQAVEEFISVRSEDEVRSLILHCKDFAWPNTVPIVADSRNAYVTATLDNPVEHFLFDLIAPLIAASKSKSTLIALMADVNPSRLAWALKQTHFKPTESLVAQAQSAEGRNALRELNKSD